MATPKYTLVLLDSTTDPDDTLSFRPAIVDNEHRVVFQGAAPYGDQSGATNSARILAAVHDCTFVRGLFILGKDGIVRPFKLPDL